MNIKCPNCNFINFITAESCRKCETALAGGPGPTSSGPGAPDESHPKQGAPDESYPKQGAPNEPYPKQAVSFQHYPSPYQGLAPRSNSGVPVLKIVLGLVVGLIVVSLIAGAGVMFLKRSSTVAWRKFEPLQGNYQVMMPTEPRAKEPIVTPMPTGNMTNNVYTSAVIGQGSVLFCVVTYPTDLDMSERVTDKLIEEELNNILNENKSTLLSKKSIVKAGTRGFDFEFAPAPGNRSAKKSKGFGKLFFQQNHEYLFIITASEDSALLAGKDKFLTPIAY